MSKSCKQTLKIRDFYRAYRRKVKGKLNYKLFTTVINKFNLKFKKELFAGSVLTIPGNLGRCYIRKRKLEFFFKENGEIDPVKSKASIDYSRTNKLWKVRPDLRRKKYIYHTNEHSNGFRYKLKWLVPKLPNVSVINLSPVRAFKRDLNKHIKENFNSIDYYTDVCW